MKPLHILLIALLAVIACEKENNDIDNNKVADIDGNFYDTVTIGNQTWMAENLKTTRYNNGTPITNVTDAAEWSILTTGAYCNYNNTGNSDTINTYGRLYNWYAVETEKLCPSGWHVPTDDEWTELEIYLQNNGYNYDGTVDTDNDRTTNNKTSKSLSTTTLWESSANEGAAGNTDFPEFRNKSGFTAMPSGQRNENGLFITIGFEGIWWSNTEYNDNASRGRYIYYELSSVGRFGDDKKEGYLIRCVKD